MHAYKSALVLSLGGLGDFLTRWGLWQSLRGTFPRATISYLGYPSHGAMLIASGLCDEVRDFNRLNAKSFAQGGSLSAGCREDAVGGQIQNTKLGLIVSVLGTRGKKWLKQYHKTAAVVEIDPFPEEGAGISVSSYVMAQALSRGFADPGPLQISIPDSARASADDIWRTHGLSGKRVVAIHPGSGARSKNWPIEKFIELSACLMLQGAAVIVLEGEAEEGLDIPGVRTRWASGVVHIVGLDLIGVAALLAKCARYVGNDSGISHLAALMGAPSTVIFGPTDPALWAPSGSVTVIRKAVPCSPCAKEQRDRCMERRCLTGISVDEVMEASIPA